MDKVKPRIFIAIGLLLYVFYLNYLYIDTIQPLFSYMGYKYQQVSMVFVLLAFIYAILPAIWLPISLQRPSQVVYWLLYILVYVPALIIPAYNIEVGLTHLFLFNTVLFLSFFLLGTIYRLPFLDIPMIKIPNLLFWIVFLSGYALFYFYIIHVFGVKLNLVSITDVYGVRADYKKVLAENTVLLAYGISWSANVINPFLIAKGLVSRKRYLTLIPIGIMGQYIIFSITGFKTVFFSVALIIGLIIAMNAKGKYFGFIITLGTVSMLFVSGVLNNVFNMIMPLSLFVRRLIVIPGMLTGYYFDYFTTHVKLFLSNSIFDVFIKYPYELDPPHIIGVEYYNDPVTVANANFWADAYANFGYIGMILFSLVLGIFLWVFDSVTKDQDYRLRALLLGIPAISLSNSALLTTMMTHGLGMAVILAFLIPKPASLPIKEEKLTRIM